MPSPVGFSAVELQHSQLFQRPRCADTHRQTRNIQLVTQHTSTILHKLFAWIASNYPGPAATVWPGRRRRNPQ